MRSLRLDMWSLIDFLTPLLADTNLDYYEAVDAKRRLLPNIRLWSFHWSSDGERKRERERERLNGRWFKGFEDYLFFVNSVHQWNTTCWENAEHISHQPALACGFSDELNSFQERWQTHSHSARGRSLRREHCVLVFIQSSWLYWKHIAVLSAERVLFIVWQTGRRPLPLMCLLHRGDAGDSKYFFQMGWKCDYYQKNVSK